MKHLTAAVNLRPSAVNIELLSSPHSFLHYLTATASALYPATAARQGGSVAVSLVDSYEFRTADERVIFLQPRAQFDHLGALPDSEYRSKAIIEAMESIEGDYDIVRSVLPKSEYQELDDDVLGQLLQTLNPDEMTKYNESLTQARHLLLPRLMNGDVAV